MYVCVCVCVCVYVSMYIFTIGDAAEQEYATRVGSVFCAAQMRTSAGCDSSLCNAVTDHIGDERTPGWAPEIQYHGNNLYSCTSYGRQVDMRTCQQQLSSVGGEGVGRGGGGS